MKHIIKIGKCNSNKKLLIDVFHIFFKMCSTNYIITKKAAFELHLFQFFTVINNYKKIIKEKPVNPWQLNEGAMVSTQQKAMGSLSSAPKRAPQLPRAPGEGVANAGLQGEPCPHTSTRTAAVSSGARGALPCLHLLPELKQEVSRLRSVRECEQENTGITHCLPWNRLNMQPGFTTGRIPNPLPTSLNTVT